MFGKATDALGWFVYVLQRLTLMLVILGVGAEEVRGCKSDLPALWKMVLEHDDRDIARGCIAPRQLRNCRLRPRYTGTSQ